MFEYHFEKSQERYKKVSIEEAFQALHNGKIIRNKKRGSFFEYFQLIKCPKYRDSSEKYTRIQRWYGYNEEAKMGIEVFDFSTSFFNAKHILCTKWYVKID